MGTISLLLPADVSAELTAELQRACVAGGPDNMPFPTEVRVDPGRLSVRRSADESGYLLCPWEVEGFGRLMGSSATLMERAAPYHLQLELARGKVNQVRCQTADWRAAGLQVTPGLEQSVRVASSAFGAAVTQPTPGEMSAHAQTALRLGYQAAEELVQAYVEQVFQIRHQRQVQLDTDLGCRLAGPVPEGAAAAALKQACNSITLPFCWADVEPTEGEYRWEPQDALLDWAQAEGFQVAAGPLIDFSAGRLPDWLWMWERDLGNLARHMGRFVEATVRRYRARVRRWQLTSAGNWANVLGLNEDELLWLTVRLAEAAKQIDPGMELSVGIAQPWGEYMAVQERTHSPFIFADTLIRSGLNLAALDLELVMGVTPRGSYCRDLLEASRLLDLYWLLGLPLRVTLGYPASASTDPAADGALRVTGGTWRSGFSPAAQADWAAAFTAMVVSKPSVQAVHWAQFSDQQPHQFPHLGLLDAAGLPRPALHRIGELREKHLR